MLSSVYKSLGTVGKERKLFPIGIEYFNEMGSYCGLSDNQNTP